METHNAEMAGQKNEALTIISCCRSRLTIGDGKYPLLFELVFMDQLS
jgi:hypothetical protein